MEPITIPLTRFRLKSYSLKRLPTFVAFVLTSSATAMFAQNHLVVSQVYGGGGNSGAAYTNDYVELYNPTSAAISLSGYSLQYASAAGTSWTMETFPSASVQAGHYYLIQLAAGTNASAALPTPDFVPTTGSYLSGTTVLSGAPSNLSASAGKIILSSGTTILTGSCPTAAVVDLVGYGSTANCFEGTGPASNTGYTNATAFSRGTPPADTDQNATDFSLITANPHNSSYTTTPVTSLSIAAATASPASVTAGGSVTFSVTVTPGSSSTGIAVTGNLSFIGGSSTQAFTLSATANVYTFTTAVGASLATNTYSIPVSATDQQGGSANGSISLSVQAQIATTPIATLQGNRSTYVGTSVSTSGVVTLVTNAGFYIQTPSSTPGSTGVPEGLYAYSGTGKVPATAVVGNNVTVTGALSLYPLATASHTPSLELASAAATLNSTGQALPAPISVTSLTSTGGIYQLTKYESMLVTVPSLTAVSGTDGNLTENTETITSTGQFYAVITGTPRPFREPGMDFRDFPAATCPTVANCTATATAAGVARPASLTLFDDNPERLIVESSLGGGTALDVSTGAVITNATGVIDFSYATDVPYGDPARLILKPGSVTTFTPGIAVSKLAAAAANQFTVAAFNIERFFNTSSTDDLYFDPVANTTKKSSAVDVTADAYARRLKKVSLAIRTVLNSPDIISFEEAENVSVLKDISTQIDTDTVAAGGTAPGYVAYGTDSVSTFTDDLGGISIGFLVKPATVNVTNFQQMGANSTFTVSTGSTQTLNDRPSDVLHAGIKRGTGVKDYPVTVISNHLRSLSGIGTSADTRLKKELQAEMLATLIQGYQTNGEHVVAVGDLNAFQFSDGYTDTLGTITGNVGTNVAAQTGKAIVSPAAVDLVTTLPAAQQQSYVEFGNAQVLDHIVVTADIAASTQLAFAHIDSDFPEIAYNDATTAARVSDHDPALAYLALPAPSISGTVTGTGTFGAQTLGTSSSGQVFTLTNTGEGPVTFTSIAVTGDFAQTNNCGASLAIGSTCAVNVVFTPTATGSRTGSLTVTSNATGLAAVALTGTGASPTGTLTGTATFTSQNVGTTSAAQALTLTNTGSGPIAITSVAVTGDFAQTNTCGVSLAVAKTCTISVTFTPTATGSRTGTLTVTSNASGISAVALTGTGTTPDFTLAAGAASSLTIAAGSSGTIALNLASMNSFSGSIAFTCAASGTAPMGVGCSVTSPVSLTAGGTATATVTFTTTSRVLSSGMSSFPTSTGGRLAYVLLLLVSGASFVTLRRKRHAMRLLGGALVFFAAATGVTGCSSSGPTANPNGTPAGTYNYTVTATSGSVSHTQAVVLTVQ